MGHWMAPDLRSPWVLCCNVAVEEPGIEDPSHSVHTSGPGCLRTNTMIQNFPIKQSFLELLHPAAVKPDLWACCDQASSPPPPGQREILPPSLLQQNLFAFLPSETDSKNHLVSFHSFITGFSYSKCPFAWLLQFGVSAGHSTKLFRFQLWVLYCAGRAVRSAGVKQNERKKGEENCSYNRQDFIRMQNNVFYKVYI